MIILLSPAKSLDYESNLPVDFKSEPRFTVQSEKLAAFLKKQSAKSLKQMMKLSDDLAQLNYERYQTWERPAESDSSRPAMFAFWGDVYQALDAYSLSEQEIKFAQDHVRILSGFYGLMRPLDLMLPYRLEMGTKVGLTKKVNTLYQFWGEEITKQLIEDLKSNGGPVVNLASNEYFKAIKPKLIDDTIITPEFRDWKNGEYKMIGFYAKKARGLMTRFALKNKITDPEELKGFNKEGYTYNDPLSEDNKWVFTREQKQ